ncbi:aminotransferase-like domain-containing protein [Leminorella grimontii]|uniref:aminotransferase-like domain-containing protein n=1 Tax=Leminorella grimontii TaxID=82981 RepID=UPI00208A162D|nr:PLP-dependent aminotransferase family protein [Leminorella grimontii]GKX58078.1 GntR family transcriptional regulator [Leminorella grimontii]
MSNFKIAKKAQNLQSSAIRELLKHSKMESVISLGGGIPNPDLFDREGLQVAMDKVLSASWKDAFQYGLSEGSPELRGSICQLMAGRMITCNVDDVIVTSGSQQSLDILARALINPGDVVIVERPTYLAALQVLQLAEAQLASVSTDEYGMNIDELEQMVKTTSVKAVYIVPTFGNPSGVTLSDSRRRQLVELSKRYDFVIIEDDPYGEINFTSQKFKPLKAYAKEMDNSDNVIYTSTFSKILTPGARIGWLVVPAWLKRQVTNLKQATDLHTSALSQSLTYHYLETGRLAAQIEIIRESYKHKCQTLCEHIENELGEHLTFHKPMGGMFLWARFKYEMNTTEWLKKTLDNGVVYVPGEFFYCSDPEYSTLRMSYVTVTDENLKEAVMRLKASLN